MVLSKIIDEITFTTLVIVLFINCMYEFSQIYFWLQLFFFLQMLLNRIPLFSLAVQEAIYNQSAPSIDDLSVGVVICGDFNASISSQLFQFMMQRKIDLGPLDRRQMDGFNDNIL